METGGGLGRGSCVNKCWEAGAWYSLSSFRETELHLFDYSNWFYPTPKAAQYNSLHPYANLLHRQNTQLIASWYNSGWREGQRVSLRRAGPGGEEEGTPVAKQTNLIDFSVLPTMCPGHREWLASFAKWVNERFSKHYQWGFLEVTATFILEHSLPASAGQAPVSGWHPLGFWSCVRFLGDPDFLI